MRKRFAAFAVAIATTIGTAVIPTVIAVPAQAATFSCTYPANPDTDGLFSVYVSGGVLRITAFLAGNAPQKFCVGAKDANGRYYIFLSSSAYSTRQCVTWNQSKDYVDVIGCQWTSSGGLPNYQEWEGPAAGSLTTHGYIETYYAASNGRYWVANTLNAALTLRASAQDWAWCSALAC